MKPTIVLRELRKLLKEYSEELRMRNANLKAVIKNENSKYVINFYTKEVKNLKTIIVQIKDSIRILKEIK